MATKPGFFSRIGNKISAAYKFIAGGVWQSPENTLLVRVVKTINLAFTSFFDRDLQNRAASLTYSTLLALVPALALIFAIGRGFGLQDVLSDSLFSYFPSQREAIATALKFVDSYLNQSSQGIFVGVGIIVLLWTLVSLLSSIEDSFNYIWGVKKERSLYQKFTDYIAICLLIPILMICSSGISLFVSTVFQTDVHIPFLSPLINVLLDLFPLLLVWLAFSLSFLLIPNTKVKFKYAAISGFMAAIGFQIIQYLFLNGQIYVTKYNAIYGSFAFLPLLLVWMQFSWLILLAGGTLTYSLQNVFAFNYMGNTSNVSNEYMRKVALIMAAIIFRRFEKGEEPLSCNEIARMYKLPLRLVSTLADKMHALNILNFVNMDNEKVGLAPAVDISTLSAGRFLRLLDTYGDSGFVAAMTSSYRRISHLIDDWEKDEWSGADSLLVKDIDIPLPSTQTKS